MPNSLAGRTVENLIANYAYVLVMGSVTLFATPFYVQHLGRTQWGLVALCITVQGILLALDMGLAQVLPVQIAKAYEAQRAGKAYKSAVKIYFRISLIVFILGQAGAEHLANVLVEPRSRRELELAFRIGLVQFLFQLPNNAALSYWQGTAQQSLGNIRQATFSLVKHAFAAALISFWLPSVIAFMIPFAAVTAAEFYLNTKKVRGDLKSSGKHDNAADSEPELLSTMSGFGVAVLLGALSAQLDRVFLARALSTEVFGQYVLVSTLALTLMHLHGPVQRAFVPQIATATEMLPAVLGRMFALISVTTLLPCLLAAALAEPLLRWWLNDAETARVGATSFQMIAVAVGLNGLYSGIYTWVIRENLYRHVIVLNLMILAIQATLLVVLIDRLSMAVGGVVWLASSSLQLLYGSFAAVLQMKKFAPAGRHSKS